MTYVTNYQRYNTIQMILGAVLATEEGAAMTDSAIATAVGTSPWAVRRCRRNLRKFGLLGDSVAGAMFNVPSVPDPTWVEFYKRVTAVAKWIKIEDRLGNRSVPEAIRSEVDHLLGLLHTEGSFQGGGYELFKSRLERIEAWSEEA